MLCRDEIALCCEKAYTQLKVSDVKDIMMFSSDKEVLAFSKEVMRIAAMIKRL